MQFITMYKGFLFFGKVKELNGFIAELNRKYQTVNEVIRNHLQ